MAKNKIRHKKPKRVAASAPAASEKCKQKLSMHAIAALGIVAVVAVAMILTVILPLLPMH